MITSRIRLRVILSVVPVAIHLSSLVTINSPARNAPLKNIRKKLSIPSVSSLALSWAMRLTDLTALDRQKFELLVIYSLYSPITGTWLEAPPLGWFQKRLHRYYDVRVQATDQEIREGLGYVPIMRWTRRAQWIKNLRTAESAGRKTTIRGVS